MKHLKYQHKVIVSFLQEADMIIVTFKGATRGIVTSTIHKFACISQKIHVHKNFPPQIKNGKCHFVWRVVVNGVRSASMPPSEWLTIIKKHLQHKFHCNVTVAENMQQFSEL